MPATSARACSIETPGFMRAKRYNGRALRLVSHCALPVNVACIVSGT